MSWLIGCMDVTTVNVALPPGQHDLHATLYGLEWIVDAYTFAVREPADAGGLFGAGLGMEIPRSTIMPSRACL